MSLGKIKLPQPPQDIGYSQEVDDKLTDLMERFITEQKLVETPTEIQTREEAIKDIEQMISAWVHATYGRSHSEWMMHYKPNDSKTRLVVIQPYGSYLLKIHNPGSDIDAVVVFPKYVNEIAFLETFSLEVRQRREVTRAEYIKAKFPILNIVYRGIEIDLQPAILTESIVPAQIDWLDASRFENCTVRSKTVIAAITTNVKIKEIMGDQFQLFQQLTRVLKYAIDKLLISGNKLGYLGGINITLLAGYLMTISEQRLSLARLVYAFLAFYSQFPFGSKPILLNPNVGYQPVQCPMQVITTTKPEINSTSKVTESSRFVIQMQLKSALKSFKQLIVLVDHCMRHEETKPLLKPQIIDIIFHHLEEQKPKGDQTPVQGQQRTYKIIPHKEYFFKDPQFKQTGYLCIQLQSNNPEILAQAKEKLEPNFVTLFNEFEALKVQDAGTHSKIQFYRPLPGWYDNQDTSTFYIGLNRSAGDKQLLSQKLKALILNYKLTVRNRFEREDALIQTVVMDMKIEIKGGKEILRSLQKTSGEPEAE